MYIALLVCTVVAIVLFWVGFKVYQSFVGEDCDCPHCEDEDSFDEDDVEDNDADEDPY